MMRKYFMTLLLVGMVVMLLTGTIGPAEAADNSDPIIIGGIFPLTGAYAGTAEVQLTAIKMAVKETNDAGGLLGRKLVLKVADAMGAEPENVRSAGELHAYRRFKISSL